MLMSMPASLMGKPTISVRNLAIASVAPWAASSTVAAEYMLTTKSDVSKKGVGSPASEGTVCAVGQRGVRPTHLTE